jgi:hypothetical protein
LAAPRKAGLWLNIMASKSGKLIFAVLAQAKLPKVAEMQSRRADSCFLWSDVKRVTFVQISQMSVGIVVEAPMPSTH